MATVNLDIGGLLQPTTADIDQSDYDGDTVLNARALSPDTTLNIANSTGSEDVLELQQTISVGLLSTSTVNLDEDANVKLTGLAGVNVGSTFNYNLSEGSTLEMTSNFLSLGLGNSINVDLGEDATSTFIYDSTGINVELSGYPNLTGVTAGDQIQVVGATSGEYENGDLIFRNDDNVVVGRFNADGLDPEKVVFEGGSMTYACFLKGTHIATPEGEVQVETLKAGDKVLTASGGVATVKWLGHRTLYRSRIPAKDAVRAFPILIKKDAIADNVPHADLTVSPGHHLSFNGTLVPAMMLVNGQTIVQQFDTKKFQYFHVELEQFDILLAEGVPAESYVDTGNRSMFQNAAEVALNPDFGPAEGRPEVEGITIARQGEAVEAIRKQLLARAELLTGASRTTDAALCVEVNGQIVHAAPEFVKEGVYRFELPATAGDVRILSRSAVVRDVTPLARRDVRQIGVGLSGMAIVDQNGRRELNLADSAISGLNQPQDVKGTQMRWTTGTTVVPASVIQASGKATLELTVLRTYTYWVDSEVQKLSKVA